MLADRNTSETELRNAVIEIARSLEEIVQKVDQANMKLDHLIETYAKERRSYAPGCPYDLFRDTCEE